MFNDLYAAVVLIFGIVLAAACYAVRRLESGPSRIAAVLTALALLVGALVPVIRTLAESASPPADVVAPAAPPTRVAPDAPPDTGATATGSAALPRAGARWP
ncbi:hypothetical protein [Streptomyces sp. G45]|uniref:hypothetical protein n=1 Tax=Streptomyces sp. G45 TaxID=3406627 RepID=UPI003C2075D3